MKPSNITGHHAYKEYTTETDKDGNEWMVFTGVRVMQTSKGTTRTVDPKLKGKRKLISAHVWKRPPEKDPNMAPRRVRLEPDMNIDY